MIFKNELPNDYREVTLIVRDYFNHNIIRLVKAMYCHSWVIVDESKQAEYDHLKENNPPYGKVLGWTKHTRR